MTIVKKFLTFAACVGFAGAAMSATLSWQLPTTRVNGQALVTGDLTAIMVYRTGVSGPVATLAGTATTYTVPDCVPGVYSVTATAGLESAQSSTATFSIPASCAPNPPTAVTVK